MSEYKMKPGKIGDAVVDVYKKIEDRFTETFLEKDEGMNLKTGKVGDTIVDAYKKVENTVVDGYKKIENAFVDTFLEKVEGETSSDDQDTAENK